MGHFNRHPQFYPAMLPLPGFQSPPGLHVLAWVSGIPESKFTSHCYWESIQSYTLKVGKMYIFCLDFVDDPRVLHPEMPGFWVPKHHPPRFSRAHLFLASKIVGVCNPKKSGSKDWLSWELLYKQETSHQKFMDSSPKLPIDHTKSHRPPEGIAGLQGLL